MGCGGIFDFLYYMPYSRRGCGNDYRRNEQHYYKDDSEDKMTLLNRMYAEGSINDNEYTNYKQRIFSGTISFDELVNENRSANKYFKHSLKLKADNKEETKQLEAEAIRMKEEFEKLRFEK